MKTKLNRLLRIITFILVAVPNVLVAQNKAQKDIRVDEQKTNTVQLFNGKDLNDWAFKLKDNSIDPSTVFTVSNGVIHIKGSPFGYMRTKVIYSDYRLHVEWRWTSEATNSGVFVHAQLPDSIWLRCVECQLKAGNAGDFVCMNGSDMDEKTDKSKPFVSKLAASSEKPTGEWNTMEVLCEANRIEVYVNGVLQNKGTNVNLSKGYICLQSEGKDIEFRNVFLKRLNK
jgi:hypothetical protein